MTFASQEAAKTTPSSAIPHDSQANLEWTVHLIKERPAAVARIAACFVATIFCGLFLFHSLLLAMLPAIALLLSVSEYWLPVRYTLTAKGATARWGLVLLEIAWADVRHAYLTADGIKLSPLERSGSRMESLRGIFLRFSDNRHEVIAAVRTLRERKDADA